MDGPRIDRVLIAPRTETPAAETPNEDGHDATKDEGLSSRTKLWSKQRALLVTLRYSVPVLRPENIPSRR